MDRIINILKQIVDPSGFMPRWKCGKWTSEHGWIYILSDVIICFAYLTIPIIIFFLVRKKKDSPFKSVFVLFGLFIVFCGLTHLVDALMFWVPLYRLNALLLFITAVVSSITVVVLYKILPEALKLQSPAQLQKIIDEQTAELQRANQKLKASEEQFKALVNNIPDVIVLIGKNRECKFVNDSLANITNRNLADYIGKRPDEIVPDNPNTNKLLDHLEQVFSTKEKMHFEVEANTEKKGESVYVIDMIPLFDKNEDVSDVLMISKDFTTIRKNEKELNETITRLDSLSRRLEFKRNALLDFAYIVSHNLRSPTGNLTSLVTLYQRSNDEEKRQMLLEKLFDVSKQLSNTVQNLSEVVNIQNLDVGREMLLFKEVVENQIASLSAQIMEHNAVIKYDFSACESIYYPKLYLNSIFLNLLTNALKYSSPERAPEIIFTSNKDENGLITLTCKDNGLGIDLNKYGTKIFSLHKTFHNRPDSIGVGLFITKHQIRSLGGNITIESEPDKGATFIIKFNEIELL